MIRANYDWQGDNAKRFVMEACWEGLVAATTYFFNLLQAALNVPNPRPYDQPSRPGEPPRKRTGHGAGHVLPEFDQPNLKTRVGLMPGAKYMLWLEMGTRRMAARPWLLATLRAHWARLAELAASGAAGTGNPGGSP